MPKSFLLDLQATLLRLLRPVEMTIGKSLSGLRCHICGIRHYDEAMTLSPSTRLARFTNLEEAISALRGQGLRISAPRRRILQALFAARGPLAAETIAEEAGSIPANGTGGEASLDAASVYRNLEAFERAGVVRHVHLGHGPGLYALVGEGEREYLYCERCHTAVGVTPTELEDLRALIRERFGHEARFTHFPIVGVCRLCSETNRE
jgi:Fur family ferric uptake transcriptional regulator